MISSLKRYAVLAGIVFLALLGIDATSLGPNLR
jgi:hypothetical protein